MNRPDAPTAFERFRALAFAWADRFQPPGAEAAGPDAVRRARLTPLFAAALIIWTPLMVVLYGVSTLASATLVVGSVLGSLTPLLQRHVSQPLTANAQLTLFLLVNAALGIWGGGIESPMFAWFAVTPMLAILMLGPKAGVIWGGVTGATVACFYGLVYAGVELPNTIPPGNVPIAHGVAIVLLGMILFSWALLLESTHEHMARELAAAKVEAERASLAKSTFLTTLSHEVRTPLNGMLGATELLLANDPRPEDRELIEVLAATGSALNALAGGVLDLARIEEGRRSSEPESVELRPLLESAATALLSVARAQDTELRVEVDSALPERVEVDPLFLRQIVLNLLGNAVKFTSKGEVVVAARPGDDEGTFTIEVRDTGAGIAPERIERLFERFTESQSGTGLGLSIASQIVRELGGQLRVESTPGVGSRFWFSLPLGSKPTPRPAPVRLTGRALLADDDRVSRLVGQRLLEALGLQVDAVPDGHHAVEHAARGGYQVIFLDCDMPGLDGVEAAKAIREVDAQVPIVALTASAFAGDRERCLSAGMSDFLAKPVLGEKLQAVLNRLGVSAPRVV